MIGLTSRTIVRSQRPAGRKTGTLSSAAGAEVGRASTVAIFGVYYEFGGEGPYMRVGLGRALLDL